MDLDRTPGVRHENKKDDPLVPTIWPFRVTAIEYVGEDRLQEWEDAMRNKVGLTNAQIEVKPGCVTTSYCGDWDDCDYFGPGC